MEVEKNTAISGSVLKWIAIITMLIDHFGASVVSRLLQNDMVFRNSGMQWNATTLSITYYTMRFIGRIAFPIFCFLLVEGFEHTHDRRRYAVRLLLFSIFSEIPFDLNFNNKVLEFSSQNVFFTLFIGFLCMCGYRKVEEDIKLHESTKMLIGVCMVAIGMLAAMELRTDYGAAGVFCIMMLYLFQRNRRIQTIAGAISFGVILFPTELPAILAFIPIRFYNGKRGKQIKYFFYLFYPVHLLILFLICIILGIY